MSRIKDIGLAPSGEMKIKWVERNMPVLRGIGAEFAKTKPFAGLKIALSVHLEAKTAYLCRVLEMGGAKMYVTGSNPLSTQGDVAAALAFGGMEVFAQYGCTMEEYEESLCRVLEIAPNIIIDDGGDLVHLMHTKFTSLIPEVIGGCEETTTGIHRLRAMAKAGELKFPMVMVNDADCKHMFDNRYGTGQSVWDGIMRTTNLIVAGKRVVVSGYGWCGKGVSMRAKGMGAKVIITETDPVRALEAVMDGFEVMPMREAARMGDIFVTVTGCSGVITKEHFELMKDGAILSNAGHFDYGIRAFAVRQRANLRFKVRLRRIQRRVCAQLQRQRASFRLGIDSDDRQRAAQRCILHREKAENPQTHIHAAFAELRTHLANSRQRERRNKEKRRVLQIDLVGFNSNNVGFR